MTARTEVVMNKTWLINGGTGTWTTLTWKVMRKQDQEKQMNDHKSDQGTECDHGDHDHQNACK